MRVNRVEFGPPLAIPDRDPLRKLVEVLPRPLRFLGVGGLGLTSDLGVFTLLIAHFPHPLVMRLASLGVATLVTWRLNRALTFDRSGRHAADEAFRYAAVAASAQGLSYAIFAILVLSGLVRLPQLALLIGAAIAALFSYLGQSLFAFRPRQTRAEALPVKASR